MTAIYQSPFLLALGWAIAASIWQSGILWLFYQIVVHSTKKISPAFKHNLSLVLILAAFTWFGATLADKYSLISAQQNIVLAAASQATYSGSITSNNYKVAVPLYLMEWFTRYLPYISTAYLLILLLLAVRLVNAYVYSQKIKTRGLVAMDLHWLQRTEKYLSWLHIKKEVRIYLSEFIDVPATLNYFKPIILLPVAAFNNLSPQQIESVILHELTHIKRNDYLINIIVSVIETLLFFNPFVFILAKALRKEREHCCDDFVLHFRFDPHSYASALLYLEQNRLRPTPVTAVAATGSNYQLLGRVKRIMNVTNNSFNYGQKLVALFITACILISIAWLSPAKSTSEKEDTTSGKTNNVVTQTEKKASQPEITTTKTDTKKPGAGLNAPLTSSGEKERVTNTATENLTPPQPDDFTADTDDESINGNVDGFTWPAIPSPFAKDAPGPIGFEGKVPVAPIPPTAPNFDLASIDEWNAHTQQFRDQWRSTIENYNAEIQRINVEQHRATVKEKNKARNNAARLLERTLEENYAKAQSAFDKKTKNLQFKAEQQFKSQTWDLEKNGKILKDLNIILHDLKGDFIQELQGMNADSTRAKKKATPQKRKSIWVSNEDENGDDGNAGNKTHFTFAVDIASDDCDDAVKKETGSIRIEAGSKKTGTGKSFVAAVAKTLPAGQPVKNINHIIKLANNITATASQNANHQSFSIAIED